MERSKIFFWFLAFLFGISTGIFILQEFGFAEPCNGATIIEVCLVAVGVLAVCVRNQMKIEELEDKINKEE